MTLTYDTASSAATDAVRKNIEKGAVAAYDRVPFVSASTSFTFNTDNGVSLIALSQHSDRGHLFILHVYHVAEVSHM